MQSATIIVNLEDNEYWHLLADGSSERQFVRNTSETPSRGLASWAFIWRLRGGGKALLL